ncbi:MAG: hypothetical protein RIN56_13980 [Sporomusaceae bacterium]|nr:hypothetical protein [Sporomusaceae bacterium]
MEKQNWFVRMGVLLTVLSAVLYVLHFIIFRDAHHIFIFLLEDIAFVPVHVVLITLIIDKWLNWREKQATISKLNMVVGVFFGELGTELLKLLQMFDKEPGDVAALVRVDKSWQDRRFIEARMMLANCRMDMDSRQGDLAALKALLGVHRRFLLTLLESPGLTQYESFTDLLLSVTHLSDELEHRPTLDNLPAADYGHLSMDIKRAYRHMLAEWLRNMNHLRRDYPYLYSLALRTNPFDPEASVVIESGDGEKE